MSSILAALLRREREGVGATLDITMFESLGEWMGFPAYFSAYGGTPPPRSGAYHATIVPYGPFRAGDGKTVFLSIQNEREFARFCDQVLGEAALATRSAVLHEPRAPAEPRSDARADREACSASSRRRRSWSGWRRAEHRQCAPEHHAGILGAIRSSPRAGAGRAWVRQPAT